MWWMDFTLNTITLLALALAVGIVIDDAIVVLENIFRHIEEKQDRPMPAAIYATKEIGLRRAGDDAVAAGGVPAGRVHVGIPGRFLRSFGLTMGAAILISLLVSFTLTPMLASRWLRLSRRRRSGARRILERFIDAFYQPIERAYMAMLRFSLRHRWLVVLAALGTLVSIVPLIKAVPKAFLPKNDEAQFQIDVRTPEGTSLAATQIAVERIAREVRQWPEVRTTVLVDRRQPAEDAEPRVDLRSPGSARRAHRLPGRLMNRVRNEIVLQAAQGLSHQRLGGGRVRGGVVQHGHRPVRPDRPRRKLADYSDQIVAELKKIPGAVDVDTTFVTGNPELVATVNRRKAADLGVSVMDVALASQLLVGGVKVSSFEEAGRDYDILVRADEAARTAPRPQSS